MASTNESDSDASSSSRKKWQSCFRDGLFDGKVALVTGGGTGLGYAIAKELAGLGCTVVIASRSADKCQQAADEINAWIQKEKQRSQQQQRVGGGKVVVGPSTNIRNEKEIQALVGFCVQQCGSLDLLVNNAGGQFLSPASELSARGFKAVVETNLIGTFLVCKEAYKQYMEDHGGSIVNITLCNRNGFPLMAHSGASRSGVENLSATLCTEWIGSGVRVNCVRPGVVYTDSGFDNYGEAGEIFIEKFVSGPQAIPCRRLGTAEEVSSAVVWLLSEGASYVTGTIVGVDGGACFMLFPLVENDATSSTLPIYGSLPRKARL